MTVSFGVASTSQLVTPTQELLVETADAAMYRAKRSGRNRVASVDVARVQRPVS